MILRDIEMRDALEQIVALAEKAALSGKRARALHDAGEIAQAAINTQDRHEKLGTSVVRDSLDRAIEKLDCVMDTDFNTMIQQEALGEAYNILTGVRDLIPKGERKP